MTKINTKPEVRVVDQETGKVGYFYSIHQIEAMLEQERINRWAARGSYGNSSHPLASNGVLGTGGFFNSPHPTHAC